MTAVIVMMIILTQASIDTTHHYKTLTDPHLTQHSNNSKKNKSKTDAVQFFREGKGL